MVAVATVLVVILLSLLITRAATVVLTFTGLSRETARFQARSALSGTGFTTTEAEAVVNHPVRRRVVMVLMLIGSAGLVTVIATIILGFTGAGDVQALRRVGVLIVGLALLLALARSAWMERFITHATARLLDRTSVVEGRDYASLLHLAEHHAVGELAVREGDWVAARPLGDLELRAEGVVTLGITLSGGAWLGSPPFDLRLRPGDLVIAYGPGARLTELDGRPAGPDGDAEHERGVAEHRERVRAATEQRRAAAAA